MGLPMGIAREWREGVGFHGVIHSPKAIKAARETNHQKAMRRGDRACEKDRHRGLSLQMMAVGNDEAAVGWWVVIRLIRVYATSMDLDTLRH